MPNAKKSVGNKRHCVPFKKKLDHCIHIAKHPQNCAYLRKILAMCINREQPIYRMGP